MVPSPRLPPSHVAVYSIRSHGGVLPICEHQFPNGAICEPCVSQLGFNLAGLQEITEHIYRTCPLSNLLARYPGTDTVRDPPALFRDAAYTISGTSPTRYPYADFYSRITTWKIPLIQLAALFPRPPLGLSVEFFVFCHLLGNPIGTLQDIILKFASCQGRALYWKEQFRKDFFPLICHQTDPENGPLQGSFKTYERYWKAFAIIVDSCDEWGRDSGDYTQAAITIMLKKVITQEQRESASPQSAAYKNAKAIREECMKSFIQTGGALAADRATTLFPVTVALALFIVVIIIAFIRTAYSATSATTVFINVEIYSVAFSILFFWILALVPLGAAIGSSQTENAIARILNRLEQEINSIVTKHQSTQITTESADWIKLLQDIRVAEASTRSWTRKVSGGIYSWQPGNWRTGQEKFKPFRSDKIDDIKYDVTRRYDDYHTPPLFPKACTTIWPNPTKFIKEHELRTWVKPFVWIGCVVVGLIPWIFSRALTGIRALTGPIVPGSPFFPVFVISSNLFVAWCISMRVPPQGIFGCRPKWELYIFLAWWVSWLLDNCLPRLRWFDWLEQRSSNSRRRQSIQRSRSIVEGLAPADSPEGADHVIRFYSSMVKDIICLIWAFTDIIMTQWGNMNKPNCYIDATNTYLVLPGSPPVNQILHQRLLSEYLLLTLALIIFQLFIVPAMVAWQFYEAWQVFVQRDDDKSHWARRQRMRAKDPPWEEEAFTQRNPRWEGTRGSFMRWWTGMPASDYKKADILRQVDANSFNERVETRINDAIAFRSQPNPNPSSPPASTLTPMDEALHPSNTNNSVETNRRNSWPGSAGSLQEYTSNASSHSRLNSQDSNAPLLPTVGGQSSDHMPQQNIQSISRRPVGGLSTDIAQTTGSEMNSPTGEAQSQLSQR